MTDSSSISKLKLLESLSDIYISIFVFDLENDVLIPIKSNKYIDMWSKDPVGVLNKTINVMTNITLPEHLSTILDFVNINTLDERLKDTNNISVVFAGKINGWCRARFIAVDRNENGKLKNVLYTVECIDEEKRRENHLLYLSQTDLMTGISNRGHGEKVIRGMLEAKQKGAFLLFDIDHFKSINDHFGHDVGDQILIAVADAMNKIKREQDIAMRLGGDEFAMYFLNIMSEEELEQYVKNLICCISEINKTIPGMEEIIGASFGISFYSDGVSFDELYKDADKRVYISKRSKGSTVTYR